MPSPFPGMDPYLEFPRYFRDFHNSFIVDLKQAIQPLLPEPYYAKTEERIWIEWPDRAVLSDVTVLRSAERPGDAVESGTVAVLEDAALDTELIEFGEGFEVRELSLHLYAGGRGEHGRLITSIELLSPSNKTNGSEGRAAYTRKQAELLERDVHLIEIDLLRGGEHTTAIPRRFLKRPFDYHVAARDLNLPPAEMYSYPIRLEDPLPRIAVPFLPGEGYVVVELQPVFDRCYDTGSYRREIDYLHDELVPPLSDSRRVWACKCIERWLNPPPA